MKKTIRLPVGTTHVHFGELAHLIADALWPEAGPDDERIAYAAARVNLDSELQRAVKAGKLPVKDPLTGGPHTFPVGRALEFAVVAVDDLRAFVADRDLTVDVEPGSRLHVVMEVRPLSIPTELAELDPNTPVQMEHRGVDWGFGGPVRAGDLCDQITAIMERQAEGLFTVHEAAQILADSRPGSSARTMVDRMLTAHHAGELPIRDESDRLPLGPHDRPRPNRHLVLVRDVDEWLSAKRTGYGFPAAPQEPAVPMAGSAESPEQRQDRRIAMCEAAGLEFDPSNPDREGYRLPHGVGAIAKAEGISRAAFTEDLRAGLLRRYRARRAGWAPKGS